MPPVAGIWAPILRKLEDMHAGKYRFIRQLGRGGMGTVYLARDLALERLVAIKVLSPDWLANETMVERFRREAKTIARLRHPSIVTVYGVGRTADIHYFVMDYIEGASLSDVLRTHGPLSIPVAKAIAYQVGSALDYAHQPGRGIIHRDIKPSNIVLDTEGNAFVMDFGISKVSESKTGLTRTGVIMGTPEYMSPEQCRGSEVGQASDQYSFGTVIYSMLTGSPPFTGASYRVLVAHNTQEPPDLGKVRPDCPEDLARTAERMLAKSPLDRWPDIGQALRAAAIGPVPDDHPVRAELAGLVRMTAERIHSQDGADVFSDDPAVRTPTWLRILQVPDEIERGDSFVLRATVLGAAGPEDPDQPVRWESADSSILRVEPSTGELVAVGVGSALVTARSGSVSESVSIEVQPERVARIEVAPGSVQVGVGKRVRLEAVARNKRGESLERAVFWSSSNPRTATVSDHGLVHARAIGRVSILAHCESAAATTTVSVVEAAVDQRDGPDVGVPRLSDEPIGGTAAGSAAAAGPGPSPEDLTTSWPDTAMREEAMAAFMEAVAAAKGPPTPTTPPGGKADSEQPAATDVAHSRRRATSKSRRRLPVLATILLALLTAVGALWLGQRLWLESESHVVADVSVRGPEGRAIEAAGLTLSPGDRLPLDAVAVAEDGSPIAASVAWASLDPSIATLDADGVLTARTPGGTSITATVGEIARRVEVHVRSPDAVVAGDPGDSTSAAAGMPDASRSATAAEASPSPPVEQPRNPSTPEEATLQATGDLTPSPGTLLLIVDPWANVFVDGDAHGQRQRLRLQLPPGEHRLTLENPARATVDTTFTIRSDQATQLHIPLPPREPR